MIAVSVREITKWFKEKKKSFFDIGGGKFFALRDVSFDIKKGEIFGLLGPNGAGKTTLINILSTLIYPSSGTAEILGYDIKKEQRELLEKVNFVSGTSEFHWRRKPKEILKFYSKIYLIKNWKKKVDEVINSFEVGEFKNKRFGDLSTGQKMRVMLAKSVLNEPQFLMLDEPTLGLDPKIAAKIREIILDMQKERGTTILLTSHYMFEVEKMCNRIAFIHHGKILDVGSINLLKSREFTKFDFKVRVKQIKNKDILKKNGFEIIGKEILKILNKEEEIPKTIDFLIKNKFKILNLKTKKPTLEDYFIRMAEK